MKTIGNLYAHPYYKIDLVLKDKLLMTYFDPNDMKVRTAIYGDTGSSLGAISKIKTYDHMGEMKVAYNQHLTALVWCDQYNTIPRWLQ